MLKALGELFLGKLDGDDAIETRVARFVHLAHPTSADGRKNLVGSQTSAGSQRHMVSNDSTLASALQTTRVYWTTFRTTETGGCDEEHSVRVLAHRNHPAIN